jgi:capsular exopolysaccharide synthesis family protein
VLISVTVSDPDAYLAARIANAVGQQFAQTANNLEISGSTTSSAIKVSMVKSATLPKSPSSPKTTLNLLLGLILGFGLGIGLSILRTIFDNTLKNETDLDNTALLASIAFDPTAEVKPLITQINRYAPRTESFRALRTNLQYVRAENPPTVIAITSAVPGEGKTSTSLNLAISFATSGVKTLLIEADMRRPRIREYAGYEGKQAGLSDILSGKVQGSIEARIHEVAYNFPDHELTIISSGTTAPNPAELLDSETFKHIIEYVKTEYDFVIVDCPPTLLVADAAIIASRTDGAVIVTRVAKTKTNEFLGARENLTNVGVNVIGAILNMVPYSRTAEYGRKYGYGYSSYRSYRSYGTFGEHAGGHLEDTYAPKDAVAQIESDSKK